MNYIIRQFLYLSYFLGISLVAGCTVSSRIIQGEDLLLHDLVDDANRINAIDISYRRGDAKTRQPVSGSIHMNAKLASDKLRIDRFMTDFKQVPIRSSMKIPEGYTLASAKSMAISVSVQERIVRYYLVDDLLITENNVAFKLQEGQLERLLRMALPE
ncbi:MAG: hypothetical protein R3F19_31405 [Verrucomicrobiales bacterium]